MHDCIRRVLKPLFQLLAAPGLGNPHTPYEAELMAVGAKSVAIMAPESVTTQMQKAIDAGHIVKINEKQFTRKYRIYCQSSEVAHVEGTLDILRSTFDRNGAKEGSEDLQKLQFWKNVFGQETVNIQGKLLSEGDKHERLPDTQKTTPAVEALLAGKIPAIPPIIHNQRKVIDIALERAVGEGKLSMVEFETKAQLVSVFAQANKRAEGKELFARYYEGGKGYQNLGDQAARRVGELLGFTKNDISWFYGEKYQNPIIEKLMEKTRGIRAYARRQLMLMDAPRPEFAEHHHS